MSLTAEQIAQIKEMRSYKPPIGRDTIARKLGISRNAVELIINPNFKIMRLARERKRYKLRPIRENIAHGNGHGHGRPHTIPERVLIERNIRELLQHETLTAELLGDPKPGRSALDQKRMAGKI